MPDITSSQNPRVKQVIKLRTNKAARDAQKLLLVDGWDELQLALAANYKPQTIFYAPDLTDRRVTSPGIEILTVTRGVFEKISYRENPDGWLALFEYPVREMADIQLSAVPLLIVAESIEKPGNLGAILRTADAARVDALLVCEGRVDLYNPNVIRASRGTLFSVPTLDLGPDETLAFLKNRGIKILAAAPSAELVYTEADLVGPLAVVVGAEDRGLSGFWMEHADGKVRIPLRGKINSLNVSVATALIVYEALRQRNSP